MSSPSGATGPAGRQLNSGKKPSLGASLPQANPSFTPSGATGPAGRQSNSGKKPSNEQASVDMDLDEILSGGKLPYDPEDELDWEADNLEETADPPPTQPAQPATPLSSNTGMLDAITDIQIGAPGSRTDMKPRDVRGFIGAWMKQGADDQAKAALEAQRKTAEAARNKRPRSSPTGSPVGTTKKPMNAWGKAPAPSAEDAMEVDKPAAIDFGVMADNVRPIPCAVGIHGTNSVIGNPTTIGSTPGMSVKLGLNPGKLAMPSLGLEIAISKTGVDSRKEVDYNTFKVTWEPGVEIAGNYMMEGLQFHRCCDPALTPVMKDRVYPSEIQKLVRTDEEKERLVCASFKSNAHKAEDYDPAFRMNLKGSKAEEIAVTLTRLMDRLGSNMLKFWFLIPKGKNFAHFDATCLSHLQHAVQDEKLKREYSLHLKTVRADIDSL